jgi:hypothetical protein
MIPKCKILKDFRPPSGVAHVCLVELLAPGNSSLASLISKYSEIALGLGQRHVEQK